MLAAPTIEAYPPRPISPRPITPSEIPDSQIQWVFYYSFRIISNSNTIEIQDKGKTLKNFDFHNNADEMEKKCFRKGFFFSEKEDVTVNDLCDIEYVEGAIILIIAVY